MRVRAQNWASSLRMVASFVAVLWVLELVNGAYGHPLNVFGIQPRDLGHLPGMLIWPLLHADLAHLAMNTTPLALMGFFVALRGSRVFMQATIVIAVLAGFGVWVFGRPGIHIGASGLVFGYFGFLVAVGIYEKSLAAIAIASFTLFYYGGLIFGVLPSDSFVSWEGHLFGLMAGVYAARLFGRGRI